MKHTIDLDLNVNFLIPKRIFKRLNYRKTYTSWLPLSTM